VSLSGVLAADAHKAIMNASNLSGNRWADARSSQSWHQDMDVAKT
jgi:hypothetical protein